MCVSGGENAVGKRVRYRMGLWVIKLVAYCSEYGSFRFLIVPWAKAEESMSVDQKTVNSGEVEFLDKW